MQKTETIPSISARIVLDTNIVMDMLHFADPNTRPLLNALAGGQLQALTDPECLAELERVVAYPAFGLAPEGQAALLARYGSLAEIVAPRGEENHLLPRCRDADDQKFLILAARSSARLLITRDKALLRLAGHRRTPPPCPIVKADEACRLLGLG